MKKTVDLLISERGDFWIATIQLNEDETLRATLQRLGYSQFHTEGVDPDDFRTIRDGMTVHVRVFTGKAP
jgi:hypothetical protein